MNAHQGAVNCLCTVGKCELIPLARYGDPRTSTESRAFCPYLPFPTTVWPRRGLTLTQCCFVQMETIMSKHSRHAWDKCPLTQDRPGRVHRHSLPSTPPLQGSPFLVGKKAIGALVKKKKKKKAIGAPV
jgi:hypothetical protein